MLSVAIITFNEEKNIRDCIQSVHDLASEVIVLDSFSKDRTEEFARSFDKVKFFTHPFQGHVEQKNKALEYCSNEWVLSLDADERLDQELKQSIQYWLDSKKSPNTSIDSYQGKMQLKGIPKMSKYISVLPSNPVPLSDDVNGYMIARLTWHMGRFIRYSGWYPNRRYRLFKKSKAIWIGENPHDEISIQGEGATMPGNILHYSFPDYSAQIDTVNKFSSIVSYMRYNHGRKFSFFMCIVKPFFKFFEVYIFKLGFLDGFPGFAIACATSFSTYLKFAKIYELERGMIPRPSNLRDSYGEFK